MPPMGVSDIIYDWNLQDRRGPLTDKSILFFDETLRDGLQSPSVVDPSIDDKIKLLHIMDDLGIHHADVGLPGSGKRAYQDVVELAQEIVRSKLRIRPAAAARTLATDIKPIIEISQKAGVPIEVMCFIGSSPIRQYAEQWEMRRMLDLTASAIDISVKNGLPVTFVTEDTTRARPATLDPLFRNAIDHGARRLCLSDTVGHATPDGLKALIRFTTDLVRGHGADVSLDWHGHNDRGLGLTNALHAIEAGVERVHGTALGIGERVGNAAMDQILLNLKLLGAIENDLSRLLLYCRLSARSMNWEIPRNYPLVGADAFRTATGVHAAAVIKARERGDQWLADRIYSGVPAGMFGRSQEIDIGPMSGESNVAFFLDERCVEPEPGLVAAILEAAKRSTRVMAEEEIEDLVRQYRKRAASERAPKLARQTRKSGRKGK